jgi:acyl-CoA synthetase (AMP-forming)/AMP-acid ligase II
MKSLTDLLTNYDPRAVAIVGADPDRSITYGEMAEQVERLSDQLAASGLEPGARVAIVLPNGPEFIVIFLAVVRARLTAAPFNPAQALELAALWEDAGIRAVIADGDDAITSATAGRLGIPLWPASIRGDGLGLAIRSRGRASDGLARAEDIALFLHTSGTTSKPKGVPLTHANLMCSIANIADTYRLTPADCSLLVMPLFHVHGLIGVSLSTLHSGGKIVAPSRFSAGAFWPAVKAHRVSWYSAVPTIHRTLLLRADTDAPSESGFRFVRSCSAALAPAMLTQMEDRFQAPMLEAYGMTEASHQIAANPPPPADHKPGSVGVGGPVEVVTIDDNGRLLPQGSEGEVAIKGPNVMAGYDRNPGANAAAFVNGYLRTGDRGAIDSGGYISLSGRIKELINRGGEKISPFEIEAVLLKHPAIADVACFAVPDAKYGEEVAAAVILKQTATTAGLQAFCRDHLTEFKIPKTFHIVSEFPRTATGKVQRGVLAQSFAAKK